ncbi:MAG: hypothetical protein WC470_02935 [Candidatus Paceibacterota bacterium]
MNCSEDGCDGKIDKKTIVPLRVGNGPNCGGHDQAYPCEECGRLHWESGTPVVTMPAGEKLFVDGFQVVIRA